jgi:RimJ/RimL family protein N-acetyltransferase
VNYALKKLTHEQWLEISDIAHSVVFGEVRPTSLERFSFALAIEADGVIGGFITCHEMDSETLYIQYGGVLPKFQKTHHAMRGYKMLINHCIENYKRVWTRIENKNTAMLKMAMALDFIPVGISHFKEKLLIEMLLEV